jgi:hypothetical protein
VRTWVQALIVGSILLAASGCASLGEVYQPMPSVPEGKAVVYIYRPKSFVGAMISYTVHVGKTPAVELVNGGYRAVVVDPGETEFWAETEARSSVTELLKPGRTYYLRGTLGVGIIAGRPKLLFTPEEQGRSEIASCRQIPETREAVAVSTK